MRMRRRDETRTAFAVGAHSRLLEFLESSEKKKKNSCLLTQSYSHVGDLGYQLLLVLITVDIEQFLWGAGSLPFLLVAEGLPYLKVT